MLLAENLPLVKDLAHFLAANGLKRVTIVSHDQSIDPLIQTLYRVLSKSVNFYTRIVPVSRLESDHGEVSLEDFNIFSPSSVLGNLSRVLDMVSKTKVITNYCPQFNEGKSKLVFFLISVFCLLVTFMYKFKHSSPKHKP